LTIVDLEVTNDAFPGRVFTGTAQSIYEEIKAEKPELLADIEPLEAGSLSLEKRAVSSLHPGPFAPTLTETYRLSIVAGTETSLTTPISTVA
jgi:hypothetical protein